MAEAPTCVEVLALLPELSAGVAEGGARAWALAHVAGCADCRREFDETTAALDGLILLSPEHQPAAGFEDAVFEALFPVGAGSSRSTRVLLGAAASILVAALGAGLVWWQTGDDRELAAQYRETLSVADGRYVVATGVRTATGATAGQVFAYAGHPSWAFMIINRAPSSGTFRVQLVTTHLRTIDAGNCDIVARQGIWGWRLHLPVDEIARIQLMHAGVPIMSAAFA